MNETDLDGYIKLSFPMNAAYVSSARLTASSVANRMNFEIDEIEDIKTAVSEACTYILKTLPAAPDSNFEITLILRKDEMEVNMHTKGAASPLAADFNDMSLLMIKAMVDTLTIENPDKNSIRITMIKKHKDSIFI